LHDEEAINPKLNFLAGSRFGQAREEAAGLDTADTERTPLTGVPVLLKELDQQIAGMTQTDGSRAPQGPPPDQDSHLARAYRKAGMVLLGRVSSPEFGNHSTTEPELRGPCANPWDTTRSAGGSSGGSAAAVAARAIAVAGASDGGGSIRIPSSCCGVFGLKPSRGRLSTYPYAADPLFGLSTNHAITRSVRDSAALLDIASVPVQGDVWRLPSPAEPFLEVSARDPGRLRIGLSVDHTLGGTVDAECVRAAERTARSLQDLGHHVEPAAPRFDLAALRESMLTVWAVANAFSAEAIGSELGRPLARGELEITTWELIEHATDLNITDLMNARARMQAAAWEIGAFFRTFDLWLTPTVAQPPPLLGELNRSEGSAEGWWAYDLAFNPWNPIANITGFPAASLPLYWTPSGLPIGTLLTAPFAGEDRLLQVCSQLEATSPWQGRIPPDAGNSHSPADRA
jgi:amidase